MTSDELRFDAEFMKQALKIAVEEFGDPTAADQIYLSLWCLRIVVGIERCVNDARRRTGNLPPLPVDDPGIVRLAKKYIREGCERIDVTPPPKGYLEELLQNNELVAEVGKRWDASIVARRLITRSPRQPAAKSMGV